MSSDSVPLSHTSDNVNTSPLSVELFELMMLIRVFEERLLQEFGRGTLSGTTHAYIGQEANAVGIIPLLERHDIVFSNHRCHGHFIAQTGDVEGLIAELMGKANGVCGGRGGSQHLHSENFYSYGILGGTVPCATGMALAEKVKRTHAVTVVFIGDGTLGEGVVYESLNIASLWKLPILYVVENNRIAQTTPIELAVAGEIAARFKAFGITVLELDTTDVWEIRDTTEGLLSRVREAEEPAGLVINTYRLCAHSKGDDTRDPEVIARYCQYDPLLVHGKRVPANLRKVIEDTCRRRVEDAFVHAETTPFPTADTLGSALDIDT